MESYITEDRLVIFTPRNIFNFLAGCFCFYLGWLHIMYPWYYSLGVLFGALSLFFVFSYPLVGLYLFLAIVYIRPQDYYPVLGVLNLTRSVAILMLVVFAVKTVISRKPFVVSKQNKYLLLITLLMAASSLLSGWPAESMGKWFDYTKKVLTFFVIINLVDTKKKFVFLIWFYVLLNFAISGQYIWQYITGYGYQYGRLFGLTTGFLGNADEIAITFIVSLPLAVALYFEQENYFLKSFFALGAFSLFFSTILTMSRGALLSVIAVIFLLFYMYRSSLKKIQLYQVILFLLAAAAVLFRLRGTILGLLERSNDFDDPAVTGRFDAWKTAWKIIKAYPLFGVGRGNFVTYWTDNFAAGSWGQRQVAHNILLQVAAETGLINLIFYLKFIFQSLFDWNRFLFAVEPRTRDDRFILTTMRCLVVSILGFLSGGMFITVGFTWHIFLLVAFFVAAEKNLLNTYKINEWQEDSQP